MCLYPRLIKNRKYIANKKNGGNIPPIFDERTLYVPVGCGKCIECMKKKAREWQIRLAEEIRYNKNGKFVTFTFSEESLINLIKIVENEAKIKDNNKNNEDIYEIENECATKAVRRFLERWRKKYKKSVKHWLVTELGKNNTERIHLHGIIFTDESKEIIENIWKYGQIWVGNYVNEKTINYITKYINKIDEKHKNYKSIILCSSGIGKDYFKRTDWKLNKYKGEETKEYYRYRNGNKSSLPIYYRNKIYSEEDKEKLWLQKLDKEERWVMGERVSVEITEDNYIKLRDFYRSKNKRLGYGDDKKKWNEIEYMKKLNRLKKLKNKQK